MITDSIYALMAGRRYQSTRDANGINWFPVPLGWDELLHVPQETIPTLGGFEASVFGKTTPGSNAIVIAFAGTASGVDWYANSGGFLGFPWINFGKLRSTTFRLRIQTERSEQLRIMIGSSDRLYLL